MLVGVVAEVLEGGVDAARRGRHGPMIGACGAIHRNRRGGASV
jgi:hypothetical protein